MPTSNEPENFRAKTKLSTAYAAGKQSVVGIPRWKVSLVAILSIVVGNIVRDWLVSEHYLPQFEAFLLATAAVLLFALVSGLALIARSHRKAR